MIRWWQLVMICCYSLIHWSLMTHDPRAVECSMFNFDIFVFLFFPYEMIHWTSWMKHAFGTGTQSYTIHTHIATKSPFLQITIIHMQRIPHLFAHLLYHLVIISIKLYFEYIHKRLSSWRVLLELFLRPFNSLLLCHIFSSSQEEKEITSISLNHIIIYISDQNSRNFS